MNTPRPLVHSSSPTEEAASCRTPGCGRPVDPEDVKLWAERAASVPRYWHEQFAADGHPASPEGLCSDCGAEWVTDLEAFRDENRCDGVCSPYDHCVQCVMDEAEL